VENKDHYSYRVIWSEEDGEYAGLCTEFPSLSWLAKTHEEAFAGIRQLVSEVVDEMNAGGEIPPEPMATKSYSGKFMVRVPPEVHRELAMEASESGVSLNRIVSVKLSR